MWDDFGDGWTGGSLDLFVNENLTLSGVTLATGSGPETIFFNAATGDTITTVWTAAGSYPDEPSYCIYAPAAINSAATASPASNRLESP